MQKKISFKKIGIEDLKTLQNLQEEHKKEINNIWTSRELNNLIKKKNKFCKTF